MVSGDITISGGFGIKDTTGIDAFISSKITSTTSGASVFTYPDANGQKVYIGVVEQRK